MTETAWLACSDLEAMLRYLRVGGSERKLHLFAAACCRRIWHLLPNAAARREVEHEERRIEGESHEEEVVEEDFSFVEWDRSSGYNDYVYAYGTKAVEQLSHTQGFEAAAGAADQASATAAASQPGWATGSQAERASIWTTGRQAERIAQCDLLREIFGSPFRRAWIEEAWLAWQDSTVVKLAHDIYVGRAFDLMPVLADALEKAGCHDADILDHCRLPGKHVRGCWVIDCLLGKE